MELIYLFDRDYETANIPSNGSRGIELREVVELQELDRQVFMTALDAKNKNPNFFKTPTVMVAVMSAEGDTIRQGEFNTVDATTNWK